MKLFILGLIVCLGACAPLAFGQGQNPIEIIVDGQSYDSIEKYKEAKLGILKTPATSHSQAPRRLAIADHVNNALNRLYAPSALNAGRYYPNLKDIERYLYASMELTRKDPESENYFDPFFEFYSRISLLGFNTGVVRIVEEFTKHSKDGIQYKRLMAKDLEATLSRSFETSDYKGPILIISSQQKLRILTLEDDKILGKSSQR